MEEKHRKLLREKRTEIINNLANPNDLNNLLYEKGIFNESMKQEVEAKKTSIEQTRTILDILPKRGPDAFRVFRTCLVETSNGYIEQLLVEPDAGPERSGAVQESNTETQSDDDILPLDRPNLESQSMEVVLCSSKPKNFNSPSVYPMKKRRRGQCVIISNKLFSGPLVDKEGKLYPSLETRDGTELDAGDVSSLFKQLHFTVNLYNDQNAEEIRKIVYDVSNDPQQRNAECFVFVICSHGTSEGVYGSDGDIVSLEEITAKFDGDNCPDLREKPKLFFIQACRGEDIDRQTPSDTVEQVGQDLSQLVIEEDGTVPDSVPDRVTVNSKGRTVPVKADMLVACATHPGYVSIRETRQGTWFLQAVVHVFKSFAHKNHIDELLTLVKQRVAGRVTKPDRNDMGGVMQAPHVSTSLTRNLYFFPGLFEDS